MEEDKKKRKTKKKKNKQHRTTENPTADGPGALLVSPPAQNLHVTEYGKTSTGLVDDTPDAQDDDTVLRMNLEWGTHLPKDVHCALFAGNIEQFQEEKDAHEHKEVILEEKIQQLLREKDVILQTEVTLLEKIEELQNENATHIQREASLEEQILLLEKEKDAYLQKVDALEKKFVQMQIEDEAYVQKEACFEEKINRLVDEAATLSLKKVSLEEMVKQMERERDSGILQENSSKEVITKLNGDNSWLKSQVVELEELRNSLLQENHLLSENISALQSQILNLERTAAFSQSSSESKMHTTENGDISSQTEAAHALVEKLIAENAQLVGKVNELYVELDHKGLQQETSSADSLPGMAKSIHVSDNTAVGLHPMVGATETQKSPASDSINEASTKMLLHEIRVQSQEDDVNNDVMGGGEHLVDKQTMLFSDSSEITKSDEIVQIPLDENENKPTDVEAANNAQKTEIPLFDAPLIGAPFRLISFVARYVSGADLVEKNTVNVGRQVPSPHI